MNLDQAATDFVVLRPRLFGIACRIVGNAPDAEDIVQDVWLRWQRTDRPAVVDPAAFLATATTRLAINLVRCARRRHETYVASWQFEEHAADDADPHTRAEQDESIDRAARMLLERLSPAERATYVLREGFEYPYRQIADMLRIEAPNARQLVKRARDRLSSDRRHPYSPAAHDQLVRALASASRAGDLSDLKEFLTAGLAEQAA
ncbi:sigma-70 family RNA polymerase sigma factor [Kribbella turkmenica]|uniref:Sigma-70 family RNA polymerase sigma factor n=1 Tax=Kribbella turkmenica TaxID=2530375 RepID=A0A4R4WYR8_9ACTN|nr:sigma-70 family RNA polymerase sigma factor [Kribbella turkmenica]TDD22930.1 sigma-70 family RNA polymerase sigma factor [Kribbella turkmenica]